MSTLNGENNTIDLDTNGNDSNLKKEDNPNNKPIAFNHLLQLQLLIQKHSGLKELCKL